MFEKIKMQAVYFPNDFMKYLIKKEIPSILSAWNSYNFELYYSRIKEDLSYPLLDGLPVLHQMYDLKGSDLVFYYLKRSRHGNILLYVVSKRVCRILSTF